MAGWSEQQIREFMSDTEPFTSLSAEQLERLTAAARPVELTAGQAILERGQTGQALYLVARGRLEVLLHKGDQQQPLGELAPGQFFGEIALLTSARRTATVKATQPSLVLEIPAAAIGEALAANEQFKTAIARTGAQRSREALERLLED